MNIFGVSPGVTQSPMVDLIFAGKYEGVMGDEMCVFDRWKKEGKIFDAEYIARSMVKAAMGRVKSGDPEVLYVEKYGSTFIQPVLPAKL